MLNLLPIRTAIRQECLSDQVSCETPPPKKAKMKLHTIVAVVRWKPD